MAVLLAGLPTFVPATTVNRLCGSSLDAAIAGARAVETGDARGGRRRRRGVDDAGAVGAAQALAGVPGRRHRAGVDHAGVAAGQRADAVGVDGVAGRGQRGAGRAARDLAGTAGRVRRRLARARARGVGRGFYDDLVVPVPGAELTRDESIRADSTPASLAGLRPAFRATGTITAGNASPLNDGAAAVLIGSEDVAGRWAGHPLARIAGRGVHAVDPQDFGLAPIEAANTALAARGHRLGRRGCGRAERGLRRAVTGLHRRLGHRPVDRQRPGRRDRDRPPARAPRGATDRHPREATRRVRRALGCRRDLHRRRPGPRRRPGERVMTPRSVRSTCRRGRRHRGRRDRAGQRLRHGGHARAADRRAHRRRGRPT